MMSLPAMPYLLAVGLYRPSMAWGLIVIVLVIVLLSGLAAARREQLWWPLVLRVVAVGSLGWVLLGYSESQPGRDSDATLPKLSVLIDTSLSMAEEDAIISPNAPAVSRLKAVNISYLSDDTLAQLRKVADVELTAFDEQLRPANARWGAPQGPATELYRAIEQINADAALILSDGHDTTGDHRGDAINAGRLFAVPVGTPRTAPDLALQAWPDSDRLFEDQSTVITASVQHNGFAGQQAQVELLLEGQPIDTQTITLDQRTTTVRFNVAPPLAVGQTVQSNHYTARVRLAQGDEAYPDNNAEHVFIQTSRGQVKLLLLEGEPYWDTRSLARLITSHPRFDLTASYAFGSDRRAQLIGETIDPATDPIQQLNTFDIVILGRQVQRLVDKDFASRLSDYVRSGGAVVFARGQPFEPEAGQNAEELSALTQGIDAISPVKWAEPIVGEMRVRLGESSNDPRGPLAGLQEGEVLTRLPGMLAATQIDGRKTASLIMLEQQSQEGPPMAAMTSLRVGAGISLAVLTEGFWRWELLPGTDPQDTQAQSVYGVLWVRALQWLASGGAFLPGQDIALEANRLTADLNQPINLRISTRYVETTNLRFELTATHSDGSSEKLSPTLSDTSGTYTASFTPKQAGTYTLSLTTPGRNDLIEQGQVLTTRLAVIDRSPERRDTSAKPEALKQLVEPTGGQCLELGENKPVIDYLQTLQALRGSEDTVDYAFTTWPMFALIAGCFGLEWIARRRMGLR